MKPYECPDPMTDWEGYMLWCEMHPCTTCDGSGEVSSGYDGDERTCGTCDGTGIDPSARESVLDED